MESFFTRHKNVIVLATVLFAQFLGLGAQVRRHSESGSTRLIRVWAVAIVTPVEKAVVHSYGWVQKGWTNYFYLRNVRRENDQLREQMERMRLEQVRLQQDASQARRIQALLGFKEQYIEKTVAAQVIGASGTERSRVIYIDKGSEDGIRPSMAVITPEGIVGKVLTVFPTTAQVLQITDQSSGVGAILVNSRLQGILKGTVGGAEAALNYIMADEKVSVGDEVVTSGGDQIFPKGLPIGRVSQVSNGRDLFLNIRVRPSAPVDRLEEVLVITDVMVKPPDTKDLGPIRAIDILAQRLPSVPTQPATGAQPGANGAVPNAAAPGAPAQSGTPSTASPVVKPAAPARNGAVVSKPAVPNVTKPIAVPKSVPPAAPKRPASNGPLKTGSAGVATRPSGGTTLPATQKPTVKKPKPAAPAPSAVHSTPQDR